jgi:hypothetical protein
MTNDELNSFIKHYVEEDQTKSAIMLTAPWGTGKSYYIQNSLIPYLRDNASTKCVVISLYGQSDLHEVSKSVFMETKLKALNKDTTKVAGGKLIAKTIIKGVASFWGVNLDINEEDLQKLYASADLSGKLLIFEDLERSGINILSILGYINNLVEQDGVKVLLVANESEIIKYDRIIKTVDGKEQTLSVLSEAAKQYLKIKEKTVNDTIYFYPQTYKAIDDIFLSFKNESLNKLLEKKNYYDGHSDISHVVVDEIMSSKAISNYNLRSLIFGCQKSVDLFALAPKDAEESFLKQILFGTIAFSLKKKSDESLDWNSKEETSPELGTSSYPLFKFCFEYVCYQRAYKEEISSIYDKYIGKRNAFKIKKAIQDHIDILYSYYVHTEKEVLSSLKSVKDSLKSKDAIPVSEYGRLANYLVAIEDALGCVELVDECKANMLNNVGELDDETLDMIEMHSGIQLDSSSRNKELNDFVNEIKKRAESSKKDLFGFDYTKNNIDPFYQTILKKHDSFVNKRCFAKLIDADRLGELLKQCAPCDIEQIRRIFHSVYSFSNINDFFSGDKTSLIRIKDVVDKLIAKPNDFDKIQILQLKYLSGNLSDFISRLI